MHGVRINPDYRPGSNQPSVYYDPLVLVEIGRRLMEPNEDTEAINNIPDVFGLFDEPVTEENLIES